MGIMGSVKTKLKNKQPCDYGDDAPQSRTAEYTAMQSCNLQAAQEKARFKRLLPLVELTNSHSV
jgi:hypothetical protein